MTLHVWRYPIAELLVPIGYRVLPRDQPRIAFQPYVGRDYFGFPLSYDDFTTGPSDYDTPSDEIYCPCGVTLPWDGDIGDALRRIDDHCHATLGHPAPAHHKEHFS